MGDIGGWADRLLCWPWVGVDVVISSIDGLTLDFLKKLSKPPAGDLLALPWLMGDAPALVGLFCPVLASCLCRSEILVWFSRKIRSVSSRSSW